MNKRKLFIIFIILVFIVSYQTASIAVIKGTVNTETVRVREEATTESDIVKLVSIGDKITVTGESGDWYKVKVENITGYIRKDLLDLDGKVPSDTSNNQEPINNNSENGSTNVDNENDNEEVGNNADGNEDVNNQVDNNPSVEKPIEGNLTTMGEDKIISTITLNEEEKTVGAKKKLANEVKLKILPLVNSNNIITVLADTEVTIVEIINNWCRIETEENSGWIRIDQ